MISAFRSIILLFIFLIETDLSASCLYKNSNPKNLIVSNLDKSKIKGYLFRVTDSSIVILTKKEFNNYKSGLIYDSIIIDSRKIKMIEFISTKKTIIYGLLGASILSSAFYLRIKASEPFSFQEIFTPMAIWGGVGWGMLFGVLLAEDKFKVKGDPIKFQKYKPKLIAKSIISLGYY